MHIVIKKYLYLLFRDLVPCIFLKQNVILISSLKVCMVKKYIFKINFVVTPRNFIIAKLSIRKPGFSSVLIIVD
jgi:hypothetical protein